MEKAQELAEIAFKAISELESIIPHPDGPIPDWQLNKRDIQARRVLTNAKEAMAKVLL